MPSRKNPNGPSKNRLAARAAAAKKVRRKKSEFGKNKICLADVARGARPGLLPNSGPRAKVSAKKARKLEKKMGYALQRKMEAEGEKEMRGWHSLIPLVPKCRLTGFSVDAPDMEAELENQLNGEAEMDGIN